MTKPADEPNTLLQVRVPPAMARMIDRRVAQRRKKVPASEDPNSITRSRIVRELIAEGLAVKT